MRYDVTVTREGRWWMIHIPELDGVTQARRVSEIELMAREYIAVTLDVKLSDVDVSLSYGDVGGISVGEKVALIRHDKEAAAQLEAEAAHEAAELAKGLASADVPLRDIGALLGVSHQRAHQLVGT
jgi:predicted RNase H-like HicB family nuclease